MATIEQSLQLHDKFTEVLEKVDKAVQNTLGTFENFDKVMTKEMKLTGTEAIEKNLASTNDQVGKVVQGIEGLQATLDKLVEHASQRPLVNAAPTTQELDKVTEATERTGGVFDRLKERMSRTREEAITEPLVKAEPTVQALDRISRQSDNTQKSLQDIHFGLEDSVGRAREKLDILTQSMRIQGREADMLKNSLQKAIEEGASPEALLRLEKQLNASEAAFLRKLEAVNRAKEALQGFEGELIQVEAALQTVGQSQGMSFIEDKIKRATAHVQTLIDRVKQIGVNAVMTSTPIEFMRSKFETVKNSIQQSELAQSRFGQAISTSAKYARDFGSGLGRAFKDAKRLTLGATKATAGLVFGWWKVIPVIRRGVDLIRQKRAETERTTRSTNGLGKAVSLVKFGAWVMAIRKASQLISHVTDKVEEMTRTMNRINVMVDIMGNDASVKQVMDEVMAAALDARVPWQDTAQFVTQLGISAGEMFSGTGEIAAMANLIQKSFKISGASAEEMNSSMQRLAVGLQKGRIEGQELTTIMNKAPLVMKAIADHLGVSTQELRDMAGEGMITADVIKNAMFAAADEIETRFEQVPMTWRDRWIQVANVAGYAFEPLRQAINEFMGSETMDVLFDSITRGFVFIAQIGQWAFQIITAGLDWVSQYLSQLTTALVLVGTVFTALVAIKIAGLIKMALAWLGVTWPIVLITLAIYILIQVFDYFGITAGEVLAYVVAGFVWLGTAIYGAILFIIGLFVSLFQFIYNQFVGFTDNVISVVEFFMNVWSNPIYSVQMLFYNFMKSVINFFASIVDGAGAAGDGIANAFFWGVNAAIKSINALMGALRSIPIIGKLFGSGTIDLVTRDKSVSAGDSVRALAESFNPGEAPEGYKSLDKFRLDMKPVDGLTNALGKMPNPNETALSAFEGTKKAIDGVGDFMNNFDMTMDENMGAMGDLTDRLGGLANAIDPSSYGSGSKAGGAADKLGKGKEVGDVGKIKSDVSISDEDLKYLRDMAETNFIVRLQQLSPQATINLNGSVHSDEDAEKLLAKMEKLIMEQAATNLN